MLAVVLPGRYINNNKYQKISSRKTIPTLGIDPEFKNIAYLDEGLRRNPDPDSHPSVWGQELHMCK